MKHKFSVYIVNFLTFNNEIKIEDPTANLSFAPDTKTLKFVLLQQFIQLFSRKELSFFGMSLINNLKFVQLFVFFFFASTKDNNYLAHIFTKFSFFSTFGSK